MRFSVCCVCSCLIFFSVFSWFVLAFFSLLFAHFCVSIYGGEFVWFVRVWVIFINSFGCWTTSFAPFAGCRLSTSAGVCGAYKACASYVLSWYIVFLCVEWCQRAIYTRFPSAYNLARLHDDRNEIRKKIAACRKRPCQWKHINNTISVLFSRSHYSGRACIHLLYELMCTFSHSFCALFLSLRVVGGARRIQAKASFSLSRIRPFHFIWFFMLRYMCAISLYMREKMRAQKKLANLISHHNRMCEHEWLEFGIMCVCARCTFSVSICVYFPASFFILVVAAASICDADMCGTSILQYLYDNCIWNVLYVLSFHSSFDGFRIPFFWRSYEFYSSCARVKWKGCGSFDPNIRLLYIGMEQKVKWWFWVVFFLQIYYMECHELCWNVTLCWFLIQYTCIHTPRGPKTHSPIQKVLWIMFLGQNEHFTLNTMNIDENVRTHSHTQSLHTYSHSSSRWGWTHSKMAK